MTNPQKNSETRATLALAVGRYLQAANRFEHASQEFNKACSTLRNHLDRPSRFVTKIDGKHYLVTSDKERNFEVEELALI
jgi:hypothetical protein